MLRLRRTFVSLLILAIFPLLARSQGPMAPPAVPAQTPRAYQNSSDGLRWQLQDILNAARQPDDSKLESMIKQLEIPDYENWFNTVYGSEAGERMAGTYRRNVADRESDLEAIFHHWASEDGEFSLRKLSDVRPPPGTGEVITPSVRGLQDPADPYLANWHTRGPSASPELHPVGFFVYIDGSFRCTRAFRLMTGRPMMSPEADGTQGATPTQFPEPPDNSTAAGNNSGVNRAGAGGVGYPTCTYCPDPEYTKEARKKRIEGTVVLQVIVQPDGHATDIKIVKSLDAGLTQNAVDAVSRWRFNPARRANGEAVPVIVPIEVTFRIAN